jgi:hypothetical protein
MADDRTMQHEWHEERRDWTLWFGLLGGAVAWSLHLIISYSLVLPICLFGGEILLHLVSLVLAAVCAAALFFAWKALRRSGQPMSAVLEGEGRREGFMALLGVVASALFLVAVIVAWVPVFFIGPCEVN